MSTEDGQGAKGKKEGDALVAFLLENRTLMNFASIIMIIYAVWATIEVITNAYGAMVASGNRYSSGRTIQQSRQRSKYQ